MAQVPAGVSCQRYRQVWETYTSDFIAISIDSRHECRIGFALSGWKLEGPPVMGLRAIVQAESVERPGWKPYSGYLRKDSGKRLRWHCSAICKAGMATWWGWCS
jgi:hypothetical protein